MNKIYYLSATLIFALLCGCGGGTLGTGFKKLNGKDLDSGHGTYSEPVQQCRHSNEKINNQNKDLPLCPEENSRYY